MPHNLDVHIALADSGWILEKLASQIAVGTAGITYGLGPRPGAAIQYYMNYSARRARVSPVEIAFFTHAEEDQDARARFFEVAHGVDRCVCMSQLYADLLRNDEIANIDIIVPGVDFEMFRPKLQLGVVGRTYKTGRKGEDVVRQLMDLDFVDWHFTGDGWPLPGSHPTESKLPDFYRSMDYIVVPSLYEGGPMCVLEALACGTPVIAPPVGWVKDYPHIEYPIGDVASLRQLLRKLFQQKADLASSVAHRSWERWRSDHIELMRDLMPTGQPSRVDAGIAPSRSDRLTTAQILHGTERASRGGPSARVPKTAAFLAERGLHTQTVFFPEEDVPSVDVAHLYNIWPPQSALKAARRARRRCDKLVFSPIFLNLALRPLWDDHVGRLISETRNPAHIAAAFRELNCRLADVDYHQTVDIIEPVDGYFSALRMILTMSDETVCLSHFEASALRKIYGSDFHHTVIYNPVDETRWRASDGEKISHDVGLNNYVLCVGRIEPRKNQLALALALRNSQIPVLFLGGIGSQEYADALRAVLGKNMKWIDHIDHDSDMLASIYRQARVLVSASWAEGASLSLLEGAASGAQLIIHDTGSEREYFGQQARYISPADLNQIREAVETSHASVDDPAKIRPECSWTHHINALAQLYDA
ncbi:MAG: glycosyltransferase [Cyanobacteria bacterium J06638_22]